MDKISVKHCSFNAVEGGVSGSSPPTLHLVATHSHSELDGEGWMLWSTLII